MMLKKILCTSLAAMLVGGANAATVFPADIVNAATFNWGSGPNGVYENTPENDDINDQWGEIDLRGAGTVAVTGNFLHNGSGSLEFGANGDAQAKAGVAFYPPHPTGFGPFSEITAASYEWHVEQGLNAPAMRIFLFDGEAHVATLIWLPTNDGGAFEPGSWQAADVLNGYVWQTRGNAAPEYLIPANAPKLFSELQADGNFANLIVRAVEIGFGAGGWGADFVGAADNVVFAGESARVEANFEVAPLVAVAPTPVPTMGEWSLILLSSVLGGLALVRVRRSRKA